MKSSRSVLMRSVASLSALGLLLAACSSDDSSGDATAEAGAATGDGDAWQVAQINDVTGTLAVSFAPSYAGFQACIDHVNDQGGVHGRPIEVTLYDAQSDPDVALTQAQRAIGSNPLVVTQQGSSASAARLAPTVSGAGLTFVTGSPSDEVMYPAQELIFGVALTATQQGEAIARQIERLVGFEGTRVAFAAGNSPYIDSLMQAARDIIEEGGGEIGAVQRFDFGIPSFAAQAGNILRDNPDVIVPLAPANDTVTIGNALREAGLDVPLVSFNGAAASEVLERLAYPDFYAVTEVPYPEQAEEFLAVVEEQGHSTKDVLGSHFSVVGCAMAFIVAEGIELCGPECTPDTYAAALEEMTDFEVPLGVTYGPVSFDAEDHVYTNVVRFHSWDPDAGETVDDELIELVG